MAAVCLEDIIGKEDVGNLVLGHVGDDILREITGVDDMNLLKREEQIAWDHIAEAVLEDDDTTTVMRGGAYLCEFGVTTHHRTIGSSVSVLELKEEGSRERLALTRHLVVLVDSIVGIRGSILHTFRDIINEVLGSVLDGDVL